MDDFEIVIGKTSKQSLIKKFGPQLVSQAADGDVGEEVEGEVTDALGGFVDEMFPEAA